RNLEVIREAVNIIGKNKLILSIDMYKQKVLSNAKRVEDKNPIKIANVMEEIGVNELILLDLFRVGQKIGGIPQQYLKIQDSFRGNIFVGGGIKDYKDLIKYKKSNFAGVLIATALYDGGVGYVGSFLLHDKTGDIRIVLWDDQVNIFNDNNFEINGLVKIINGIARNS
ncbi:unnamed protein product, partial [marine sediment metagenome]